MALKLITPPNAEPLELADVEAQCRADLTDEAVLVAGYISAIRAKAELYLRRALITQTHELVLDQFPSRSGSAWGGDLSIKIPLPPLQSVESIKYIYIDGSEQTLDPSLYEVDTDSEPGRIFPAYGKVWPPTRVKPNAVRVRFSCGYGDTAADVPMCVKQWMLLNVADLYENREMTQVGARVTMVDATTLADGLLDAVPGGRAFEF